MLTVDDQPVDLDRDPRPAVGRTVVQTRPEDPTGPRTVGILCIAGAGLLVGGAIASWAVSVVLAIATAAVAVGAAYLGVGFVRDAQARATRAALGLAVHYGLDGVALHTATGAPEPRPFDAAFDHPLGGWAPRRLRHLVAARAALRGEHPDGPRRAAIELAALHRDDFPGARTVYIAFPDTGMRILGEEEGAREFVRGGVEVWAVNAARDGADGTWRPILEKRAARKYGIPYGQT